MVDALVQFLALLRYENYVNILIYGISRRFIRHRTNTVVTKSKKEERENSLKNSSRLTRKKKEKLPKATLTPPKPHALLSLLMEASDIGIGGVLQFI